MMWPAHIAAGLIVGKISGNYWASMIGSLAIDADHLVVYIRSGILWRPKEFWKTIISSEDVLGNQRNILHSVFGWLLVSGIILVVHFNIGAVFSVAYAVSNQIRMLP